MAKATVFIPTGGTHPGILLVSQKPGGITRMKIVKPDGFEGQYQLNDPKSTIGATGTIDGQPGTQLDFSGELSDLQTDPNSGRLVGIIFRLTCDTPAAAAAAAPLAAAAGSDTGSISITLTVDGTVYPDDNPDDFKITYTEDDEDDDCDPEDPDN